MTNRTVETSPQVYARIAGFLYLIVIVLGMFAELFVRGQMIVSGDAAATARNILAHEQLYRAGFALSTIYLACNMPLALIFYRLFKNVNGDVSWLVVFFLLLGSAIESASLLNHFAPLIFLGSADYLSAFSPEQLQAQAYMSLRLFAVGFLFSLVIFSFYCLSTGYLIFRSTFLPRILGVLMAIAGVCYLFHSLAYFLAPHFARHLIPYILVPCFIAETSLCLWLIVKGVNVQRWQEQASATGASIRT